MFEGFLKHHSCAYRIILKTIESGRGWETTAHFVIAKGQMLLAGSIGGPSIAVSGTLASITGGTSVTLTLPDGSFFYHKAPFGGHYKVAHYKLDEGIYHGIFVHKDADYNLHSTSPLIIATDGNIAKAVGTYLAAKYALPQEWINKYYHLVQRKIKVEKCGIYRNPLFEQWASIDAIQLVDIQKDKVLHIIERAIQNNRLIIPKSNIYCDFNPEHDKVQHLKATAPAMGAKLKAIRPAHIPGTDPINPRIATLNRIPYPTQAHAIQGSVNAFKRGTSSQFLTADMGTGKSIIATAVADLLADDGNLPVLLSAPGITIPKWKDGEILSTVPHAKVTVLSTSEDAAGLLRRVRNGWMPKGLHFFLVATDRTKLSSRPWFTGIWKEVHPELPNWPKPPLADPETEKEISQKVGRTQVMAWHCPGCGKPLLEPVKKRNTTDNTTDNREDDQQKQFNEDIPAGWQTFAKDYPPAKIYRSKPKNLNGIPVGFLVEWQYRKPYEKCPHCGSKLYRPALKTRGESGIKPRWPIASILAKLPRNFFKLYIADEVHEFRNEGSGRNAAFVDMLKCTQRRLFLTGTLTTGLSSAIRKILWDSDPAPLIEAGHNYKTGAIKWAAENGVLQQIETGNDQDIGVITKRKKTRHQPKEVPGISPKMIAKYLMHKTILLELGDLGLPLVEIKELPEILSMDEDHEHYYQAFHKELHSECACRSKGAGKSGAWSKFIPSTIMYADRPDLGGRVMFDAIPDLFQQKTITAPALKKDYYHAKERRLVEIVQREMRENRGCVIYTRYSDSYDMNGRIQKVLKDHGLGSTILRSHVAPTRRVEWLEKNKDKKILICNMSLVQMGLDLISWPSLIFYQLNYDINVVRQASRRAWRIGQERECRVYYLVYDGTQQLSQFQRIMLKRGHAMIAEGRLDTSELAKYARDSHSALAVDLAKCIADTDLGERWTGLAEKDMDEKLRLVAEEDFAQVVAEARDQLVKETLGMCGVVRKKTTLHIPIKTSKYTPKNTKQMQFDMLIASL